MSLECAFQPSPVGPVYRSDTPFSRCVESNQPPTKLTRFPNFTTRDELSTPQFHLFSATCVWCEECNFKRGTTWLDVGRLRAEGGRDRLIMSCRVDRLVTAGDLVVLSVSGCITGEHVDMLRNVLQEEADPLAIDLNNVLLVDREAVKLLAVSENNGTELRNGSAYIREWIRREKADMLAGGPDQKTGATEGIEDV